ncbi:MAG: phage portal protein [Pseudomonadota bacterium]
MLNRMIRRQDRERKGTTLADLIALHGAGEPRPVLPRGGYTGNVVAYRCIRMIAEAAASVPLIVKEEGAQLTESPILSLLHRPNPDQTGTQLLEEVYGFLQTHGNAYVERLDDEGAAKALFLLHPGDVTLHDGVYRHRTKTGERAFHPRLTGDMPLLHLSLWHPHGNGQGHAPLKTAGPAMSIHDAACTWNRTLLDNAARPSGALIHRGTEAGQHLTPEQFDRLRAELDAGFAGAMAAGRPLLLDGGLDWRPMGMTPAEMDFQNLKNSAARDIALAFGVPPMLLGIPGDNTYSNYGQANLAFWRQTIVPLVRKVAEQLGIWLDPSAMCRVEPDLSAVEALAPERASRLDRIAAAEFLTDAEKRVAFGFPAEPEGGLR